MKKINFNAGPSIMPQEVFDAAAKSVLDFNGMGLSILEISHRSKEFVAVLDEARALFKEILDIPEGYTTVFLGGGASMQFCMVPFNFLKKKATRIMIPFIAIGGLYSLLFCGNLVDVYWGVNSGYWFLPALF